MIIHRPKIRMGDENQDSSPIEATLQSDGRIRLVSDPDTNHRSSWLTTAQARSFALELLGMCDVSDALNDDEPPHDDRNLTCSGPGVKCVCWDLSSPCELVCVNVAHGRCEYGCMPMDHGESA